MKIKGYENYSIYEDGTIISTYKNGNKIERKSHIHKNGYKIITLHKDNEAKTFKLHRLLAIHFIPNPENKPTVDHENRDPLDNRLCNLRWFTTKEQNNNKGGQFEFPITKGGITKNNKKNYVYQWCEDKIRQRKWFKTLEEAQAFQIEHLKTYNLQVCSPPPP